ncbi:hypothetical protein CcCBS67573_g01324 [Chytriomyces confervae]|uniref:Uncharacterized protein n=1 Tax=Chytriomyces confervae TaxID=246404 RepID=A0A507FQ08_9FUNG|nr:hypothetical protein HDU80_008069 [Chytriomyces hyalinus]TPX77416.1 hypothetical protein CcCBS67573_g01324 [Chytriomyces confervae]
MSSSIQTPIIAAVFLLAMSFENALKGLLLSIEKFTQSRTPIPAIMIVANTLSLVFSPMYVWSLLITSNCQDSSLATKVSLHFFVNTFSFFLLYKTWVVSRKNTLVAVGAAILITDRCIWALTDCARSKSIQIPQGCYYVQDKMAVIGISTGGILVDIFCTGVTILGAFRDLDSQSSSRVQQIYRILIADNVMRTLSVMAVNAFTLNYAMYGSLQIISGSPSVLLVIPAISSYVYTQAINLEFFWINLRRDVLREPEQRRMISNISTDKSRRSSSESV